MKYEEIAAKIQAAAERDDFDVVDDLCFLWLKKATEDFGEAGKTARDLLEIVQRLLR